MEDIQIKAEDLQQELHKYFSSWMNHEAAEITARSAVRNALEKDDRFQPLLELSNDIKIFESRNRPKHVVTSARESVESWDLNGSPGVCHLGEINLRAAEMAKSTGIGLIGLRNSGGVHQLSQYVQHLSQEDFISIFLWNGGSYTTVPFGSSEPFFGTNPIAFGIPTQGRSITADFATSQIAFRTLIKAFKNDESVEQGSGLDALGNPSVNPKKIYDSDGDDMVRLLPMGGGAKGSALMLLIEILTGALVGGVMAREATDDPFTPEEFGGLFMCIDINAFGFGTNFRSEVEDLATSIRKSKPVPGVESVKLPGDLAAQRLISFDGVLHVPGELIEQIRK